MNHYWYILALCVSAVGIIAIDVTTKKRICQWSTLKIILPGFIFLLVADLIGIHLNIFHTNQSLVSGLHIFTPDLPVEELVLLIFLPYLTLIISDKLDQL